MHCLVGQCPSPVAVGLMFGINAPVCYGRLTKCTAVGAMLVIVHLLIMVDYQTASATVLDR